MKVTFFTNFLNHHQIPVADEFYKKLGKDYIFVQTEPMPIERIKLGYPDFSDRPYLLMSYESEENYQKSLELALSSDVVIIGSASEEFIKERLKKNKLTFRYSERWFKEGYKNIFHPLFWKHMLENYYPNVNKPCYMLCASAFTKKDVNLIGLFRNKCYKWGYFPDFNPKITRIKRNLDNVINFLWVGRFLDWKHPELSVKLIFELKKKGYKVKLNMIGNGPLYEKMKKMVVDLNVQDEVLLLGSKPNDEVIDYFINSDIFLFTSNKEEGWGAVLNEAMANKCPVIASDAIGSVPYLLEHMHNGLVFKTNNLSDLTNKAELFLNNSQLRSNCAENGFLTIKDTWNAEVATKNFFTLVDNLLNNHNNIIEMGPCSIA